MNHPLNVGVPNDDISAVARQAADQFKDDPAAMVKFLDLSRKALVDAARVSGFFAPREVTVTGGLQLPSDEEARAILAKLPPMGQTA